MEPTISARLSEIRRILDTIESEAKPPVQTDKPKKPTIAYPAPRMQYQHTQREMILGALSQAPDGYGSLADLWHAIKNQYGEQLNPNSFQSVVSELKAKGVVVRVGPAVKIAA